MHNQRNADRNPKIVWRATLWSWRASLGLLVLLLRTAFHLQMGSWQHQTCSRTRSPLCTLGRVCTLGSSHLNPESCGLRICMVSGDGRRTENHLARLIYRQGSRQNPKTHSQLWVCCQSSRHLLLFREGWDGLWGVWGWVGYNGVVDCCLSSLIALCRCAHTCMAVRSEAL